MFMNVCILLCMIQEKWTALHAAAFEGHSRVADLLIKRGANINKQSDVCVYTVYFPVCVSSVGVIQTPHCQLV